MTCNPSAADWAAARGEKWRAHLDGMEAMLRPVDEPLLRALRLEAPSERPCRIADIGCGGGATTLAMQQRAPAGSVVHGFDIARGLVELARTRAPAIRFDVADVATTAPGEPYDRLASRFGVMFFDDPAAAFANLRRWLAPGGRFAFAVWGRAADNAWFQNVHEAVAAVTALPPLLPDAPGPFRYAEIGVLLALLERAGFTDLAAQDWREALPVGGNLTNDAAAAFALASTSAFAELLAKAGESALRAAHRSLAAVFARHERGGAVWMDASVRVVTGARPSAGSAT